MQGCKRGYAHTRIKVEHKNYKSNAKTYVQVNTCTSVSCLCHTVQLIKINITWTRYTNILTTVLAYIYKQIRCTHKVEITFSMAEVAKLNVRNNNNILFCNLHPLYINLSVLLLVSTTLCDVLHEYKSQVIVTCSCLPDMTSLSNTSCYTWVNCHNICNSTMQMHSESIVMIIMILMMLTLTNHVIINNVSNLIWLTVMCSTMKCRRMLHAKQQERQWPTLKNDNIYRRKKNSKAMKLKMMK